jgi:hypothetical protein
MTKILKTDATIAKNTTNIKIVKKNEIFNVVINVFLIAIKIRSTPINNENTSPINLRNVNENVVVSYLTFIILLFFSNLCKKNV